MYNKNEFCGGVSDLYIFFYRENFRPCVSGNRGVVAATLLGDNALSIIAFSSRPSIIPCFSTLERAIRDTTEKERRRKGNRRKTARIISYCKRIESVFTTDNIPAERERQIEREYNNNKKQQQRDVFIFGKIYDVCEYCFPMIP